MIADLDAFTSSSGGDFIESPNGDRNRTPAPIIGSISVYDDPFLQAKLWNGCVGYPYFSYHTACAFGAPVIGSTTMQFQSSGIDGPITWSVASGALPDGLTLDDPDPDDLFIDIIGTPTTTGDFVFTIRSENDVGDYAETEFTQRIQDPVTVTNLSELNDGITAYIDAVVNPGSVQTSDGILLPSRYLDTDRSITGFSVSGSHGLDYHGLACMEAGFPGSPGSMGLELWIVDGSTIPANEFWWAHEISGFKTRWIKTDSDPSVAGSYDYDAGTTDIGVPTITLA